MFSAVVRQQSKKLHLREWAALARKKQALRKCQKVSYSIYRQRTLTKFIALWFRNLHQSLKKKHLRKLEQQFSEKRLKQKFMGVWLRLHE